jgi:hypothetical protein
MWSEGKWMQLEDVMLSEVSQAQKDKNSACFLSYVEDSSKMSAYTQKQAGAYKRSYVEQISNSGSSLYN